MSMGKTLGFSALIYLLLNFVFMIVFVALGGLGTVTIGDFFSTLLAEDPVGFIAAMMVPGAFLIDPIAGVSVYTALLAEGTMDVGPGIIALLWVLLPGLIAALVSGAKFAEESAKTAFFGVMLGIFIINLIPFILSIAGLVDAAGSLTILLVPSSIVGISETSGYLIYPLTTLLGGCLFGGFGAMMSSNL